MSYKPESNVLTPDEKDTLENLWTKAGYPPLRHINLSYNYWTVATWNQDDVPHFENPKIRDLEKIWAEIANTDRNTTVLPNQSELITPFGSLTSGQTKIPNILTNVGMADMAKNRTAESSLGTSHVAVGDDKTPSETVLDTALNNELDRKVWSEKIVSNQTEKYAAAFVRSDFGSDVTLKEAGGFTASSGVILVFRVTFADKAIGVGQIMTIQVSVEHKNGVVV